MHGMLQAKMCSRVVRSMALVTAALALVGCATGYALVQPDGAGSGSYYSSEGPYSGQGYYDDYGTGPYYPGTSGWGYYNGTSPYSNPFAWYGGDYSAYGYWPFFNFDVGISSVWGFPGYWGPWYSTGFPVSECRHRGCRHFYRGDHHHGGHDPVARTSPRPWLKPDQSPVPPHVVREGSAATASIPQHPMAGFAGRHRLESTSFAPHDFVEKPVRRPHTVYRPVGMPAMPANVPEESHAFANRPAPAPPTRIATPHDFSAPPHATFAPAPVPQPTPHRDDTPATKIH